MPPIPHVLVTGCEDTSDEIMAASYRALAACVPIVGGDAICSHRQTTVFDSLMVGSSAPLNLFLFA